MMERKLTPEEINQLFDFCRKHYVNQYDLQIELVDHMASAIETSWILEPNISFQLALKQTYKEFGIYGFSKLKSAKEKALRKKYNRLLWQFVGNYFRLPKIIMTVASTLVIFTFLRFIKNDGLLIGFYIFLFFPFAMIYHFYLYPKLFTIKLIPGKSFLLTDYLKIIQGQLLFLSWFPFQVPTYYQLFNQTNNIWTEFFAAFAISAFTIIVYASCFFVPMKVREHFTQQFPQFIQS